MPQKAKIGKLIVISGPSGSGKSTLTRRAAAAANAVLSISATTRTQSGQEIDGQDYFFLTKDAFEARIKRDEFLEYANVFGHYYGTPKAAVDAQLEQGRTVILEIDVQGGLQVFAKMPQAVGVFILPAYGNLDAQRAVLRERLIARGRDDDATIKKRLDEAQREIQMARKSGHYRYELINDDLERAVRDLITIITS